MSIEIEEPRDGTQWEIYFSSPTREPFNDEEIESKLATNDDDDEQKETES